MLELLQLQGDGGRREAKFGRCGNDLAVTLDRRHGPQLPQGDVSHFSVGFSYLECKEIKFY
jgi:hypothetical protein